MGNIQDKWTIPDPANPGKRMRGPAYGRGQRWLAEWLSPDNQRHRKRFPTKDAAKAHLDAQEADKLRGTYVKPNRVTVGDIWPKWQTMKSRLSRTTRELYDAAWKLYVNPRWGDTPIVEVDKAAVMEWLPTLRTKAGKPMSASWARQVGIVLTGIMDMAVDGKLISANPLTKIGAAMPKQLPSERRYLTVAEVDRLWQASVKESIRLPVRVLVLTGIRRGEMAGLQVSDLDVGRGRLRIMRDVDSHGDVDATKTRRHRDVPVGKDLLAELVEVIGDRGRGDWLLPAPGGGPWTRDSWRGRWERATAAAGIPGIDTHEMRHTAASLAIHSGANVKTVQRMLGHATASMTLDIYGHLWDDELDQLPGRLREFMDKQRALPKAS